MSRTSRLLLNVALLYVAITLLTVSAGCGGVSKSDLKRPAAQPVAKTSVPSPIAGSGVQRDKLSTNSAKIIETAQITLETRDLSRTEKIILGIIEKKKGKVTASNVHLDSNGRRTGNYTLRVPSGQLQECVNELTALADVVVRQRSLSAQDVTEEFVDTSARLGNMQRHETRLREILAKANTVEEILKVEKELSTVRSQIESTTGRLKAMTARIDMSTIQLRISEVTVITETNYWSKLKGIVRDSWVAAGDVVLYLIATIIILSPIVFLVGVVVWFWKRRRKAVQARKNPPMDDFADSPKK